MDIIYKFLLLIDGVLYNFIRYIYEIFIALTKINLFGMNEYTDLANRVYIVIGLVMLFVLAYSLLKAVINPDNFAKGESSFPKLIQNVVVSLVILAVLPTIFGFVFNVQSALLNQGTITKLILSDNTTNGNEEDLINKGGNDIAFYTFRAFFSPKLGEDGCSENILDASDECTESIGSGDNTLKSIDTRVYNGASFGQYKTFSKELSDDNSKLNYYWPISTIAGGFVLYVLLNFCFDMALRTIKLAFYQIIAPIPVVCRVIPGGKMKDVFSKWVKQIISLFVEVFIRIGAIAFGIKMINIIVNSEALATISESGGLSGFLQPTFVRAILIMSVVMFIRQIPKLLGDLFGLDTGGMKLGLREKLAAGGGLLAASAVGGAAGTFARNTVAAGKRIKEAKGLGNKGKAFVGGVLSAGAGAASGFIRGGNRARGAKNFTDVRKAAGGAVDAATEARGNRAENWARYKASNKYLTGGPGMLQNASNIVWGAIDDRTAAVKSYLGIDASYSALQSERDSYKKFLNEDDKIGNVVDDLITREAVSQNAALVLASGGPNMSLDAMHEHLDIMRKSNVQDIIGKKVRDFNGNEIAISSELDYSNYLASLKNQLSASERNLKKYLKTYAFQEDGFNKMQADINNKQVSYQATHRDEMLNSVAHNASIVASAGSPCVRSLGDMEMELNTISFAAVNGKTVKDFNGNDVVINSQAQYNDYMNKLQAQYNDAKDKVADYLTNEALNNAQLSFGGGDNQRWSKIASSKTNVNNLLKENMSVISALYEKYMPPGTIPLSELSGQDAFDAFDNLITLMKDRNIDIDAEFEKLARANKSGGDSK